LRGILGTIPEAQPMTGFQTACDQAFAEHGPS
jgi:hypothetical protein